MKKILLSLLLLMTALSSPAEFRWGPQIGVNGSSYFWKQDLVTTHYQLGPTVGVMGELMIPGIGFGIDLGLRYQMRGAKVNFGEQKVWASSGYGDENVWLHTIQVPFNLRFKWTRMDGVEHYIAPFAYAGPVFNFNVAQSHVDCVEHPAGSVALQVGAGAEILEHLQVSGGYAWGVSYDLRTKKLDNFSARTQGWHINLAWLF